MHLYFAFCFIQLNERQFFPIYFIIEDLKKNKKSQKISSRLVNPVSCLVSWDKCLVTPLQIMHSNKITRATKGTWLAPC